MLEVEKKAHIADFKKLYETLKHRKDFQYQGFFLKVDLYFSERELKSYKDFRSLQTLFRVRYQGVEAYLTLKQKTLVGNTEVNKEYEVLVSKENEEELRDFWIRGLGLAGGSFSIEQILRVENTTDWQSFWKQQGFSFVLGKEKKMHLFITQRNEHSISIELNEIVGLGFFLEIELLTEEPNEVAQCIKLVDELFLDLGVDPSQEEPRLYIELLYQKQHPLGLGS